MGELIDLILVAGCRCSCRVKIIGFQIAALSIEIEMSLCATLLD